MRGSYVAKAAGARLIRLMPAKMWMARRLAVMPPPVMSGPLFAVINRVLKSRDVRAMPSLTTNLGISLQALGFKRTISTTIDWNTRRTVPFGIAHPSTIGSSAVSSPAT